MIGTTGCIGAGLDCPDVHYILRMGPPTSIISFIQEMGRCGRISHLEEIEQHFNNSFQIVFSFKDYVYLFERIYYTDNNENESQYNNKIFSKAEYREMQVFQLNRVCRMIFLNQGCWHHILEVESSNNTIDSESSIPIPCGNRCPFCWNEIQNID